MRYARSSSSFKSFAETRHKFWRRLRVRGGYPFSFLLPLLREIRYKDRKKWLFHKSKKRSRPGWTIVFKTAFNQSHARIKNVITKIMPDAGCRGGSRIFQGEEGQLVPWSCRINGGMPPKMLQFENWNLIENCCTRNTSKPQSRIKNSIVEKSYDIIPVRKNAY